MLHIPSKQMRKLLKDMVDSEGTGSGGSSGNCGFFTVADESELETLRAPIGAKVIVQKREQRIEIEYENVYPKYNFKGVTVRKYKLSGNQTEHLFLREKEMRFPISFGGVDSYWTIVGGVTTGIPAYVTINGEKLKTWEYDSSIGRWKPTDNFQRINQLFAEADEKDYVCDFSNVIGVGIEIEKGYADVPMQPTTYIKTEKGWEKEVLTSEFEVFTENGLPKNVANSTYAIVRFGSNRLEYYTVSKDNVPGSSIEEEYNRYDTPLIFTNFEMIETSQGSSMTIRDFDSGDVVVDFESIDIDSFLCNGIQFTDLNEVIEYIGTFFDGKKYFYFGKLNGMVGGKVSGAYLNLPIRYVFFNNQWYTSYHQMVSNSDFPILIQAGDTYTPFIFMLQKDGIVDFRPTKNEAFFGYAMIDGALKPMTILGGEISIMGS